MNQSQLQLVSHVLCPYVQRSVIVLLEKQVSYTRRDIDLAKPPAWFRRVSPLGKVPLLLVENNKALFESAVICEYLDEITALSLHPDNAFDKARHRAWIEYGSGILDDIASLYSAKSKALFDSYRMEIRTRFVRLEDEIGDGPYFSGAGFQLVDAAFAPLFRYFDTFEQFTDLALFDQLPKISAWRKNLQRRPSVQQAVSKDYPELLLQFLQRKESHISCLISSAAA